ncbi:mechanosensitive ion channel family protein [Geobacter anodireducens]|uniref:Mechanosensitive ion channel protein n=1 Tax=Geobacter soli TaxID=1510391 RepID=A0A0C1TSA6_9BACT|nr:mechanosensitive ion channel family protein [Geobacter soli]KIE42223.1 mechanosensitive ion channel protein [Geobacter soli]
MRFVIVIVALLAGLLATPLYSADMPVVSEHSLAQAPAAVTLNGKPLFYVRHRALSLMPRERAALISERLVRLARSPLVSPADVHAVEAETVTDIIAGDTLILTVTDDDARAEGKTRHELVQSYLDVIRKALEDYHNDYSVQSLIKGAGLTIAATILLALLLLIIKRSYPVVRNTIESWSGTRIRDLKIQSFEIVSAGRITQVILSAVRWIRILAVFLLVCVYLLSVLSFFPWTRRFAPLLLHYLTNPLVTAVKAVADYLPNLFFIAVIVVIAYFISRLMKVIIGEIGKGTISIPGFYPEWAEPTYKICRFLVIAFAVTVAFPYLPGSESPAFKGISIFLGVLFSLGSTSAVANVVAGIIITYMRAYHIGDRIKVGDTVGDVVEKNLLITRLRTIKNVDVTIPNSLLLSSHVLNYSSSVQEYGLILNTSVTIGYDTPWRQVHELLISAARRTEHVLELPEPFILQTALNDFYVTYELNAYTDKPNRMANLYSQLHQNIQDTFNEAGVEIMSPHYSQLRDGNTVTVPEQFRPAGYVPPSFRVSKTDD